MPENAATVEFWKGDFGNEYTRRIAGEDIICQREAFLTHALRKIDRGDFGLIRSIIEFGANRGLNLLALKRIAPGLKMTAVEINESAAAELEKIEGVQVADSDMLKVRNWGQHDLSLSIGVLIHINPKDLEKAYNALYCSSRRYILISEYYNPKPVAIEFQGRSDVLWKRDFAGEMLDLYPDLRVVDYGFTWRRDPVMPLYDLTWFLLEKAPSKC
ncbi:MAG: pseudaminic acid biosynthesis-associated methylase [Desulfobaccales bacterium]